MSKIVSLYTCHENQIDEKGNTVAYYQANLPHGKEIAEAFIGEWNKDAERMVEIMNEQVAKGRVESCKARRQDHHRHRDRGKAREAAQAQDAGGHIRLHGLPVLRRVGRRILRVDKPDHGERRHCVLH